VSEEPVDDRTYSEAAIRSFGENILILYRVLVSGGIQREDAVELIKEWMHVIMGLGK
jgi:hypothetical protein